MNRKCQVGNLFPKLLIKTSSTNSGQVNNAERDI
jgi:hypothetical protein